MDLGYGIILKLLKSEEVQWKFDKLKGFNNGMLGFEEEGNFGFILFLVKFDIVIDEF